MYHMNKYACVYVCMVERYSECDILNEWWYSMMVWINECV